MVNLWNELRYGIATYPLLYALWGVALLSWLYALGYLAWLLVRRRRQYTGQGRRGANAMAPRLGRMLLDSLGQRPIWRVPLAGAMHLGLFGGGLLLLAAFVGSHGLYPRGEPWQKAEWVHSVNDLGMLLVLLGLVLAAWRRWVSRELPAAGTDVVLWGLLTVGDLCALFCYGLLVALAQPQWRAQAWVSNALARALLPLGKVTLRSLYGWSWTVLHGLAWAAALLAPWTKWRHVLLTPLSLWARRDGPLGRMEALDLEGDGPYGAQRPQDLTRQEALHLVACTRCGRCSRACPATLAGRALDPLRLLESLRQAGRQSTGAAQPLAEQAGEATLWDCSACLACVEVCPAGIAPLNLLLDLRRERVLDAARFPLPLQDLFRALGQQGNPWNLPRAQRARWSEALGVRTLAEGESCEALLWLGCMGSYDERAQRAVRALLRLLQSAGVAVGTLGAQEGCCGDPARRAGNEYLWRTLAERNLVALRARRCERIVSLCPHCANTLANEYADLGAALPAMHAATYLAELLRAGRLSLPHAPAEALRLTYHDPCTLGRGNGDYASARQLLSALPGVKLSELPRHRRAALCCGGGGAQMWLGSEGRPHLAAPRAQEVRRAGLAVCAVACPYCATMLGDELAGAEPQVAVRDVVELLADGLEPNAIGG